MPLSRGGHSYVFPLRLSRILSPPLRQRWLYNKTATTRVYHPQRLDTRGGGGPSGDKTKYRHRCHSGPGASTSTAAQNNPHSHANQTATHSQTHTDRPKSDSKKKDKYRRCTVRLRDTRRTESTRTWGERRRRAGNAQITILAPGGIKCGGDEETR